MLAVYWGLKSTKQNRKLNEVQGLLSAKQQLNSGYYNNCSFLTLNPADLRRRAVALLVLGGYAEDNSWTVGGRAVNVSVVQVGCAYRTRRLCATVDPNESHLTRTL